MIRRYIATVALAGISLGARAADTAASTGATGAGTITPQQRTFFESKVRPLLADRCYKCHSAAEGKTKGSLALDTHEGITKGGDNGLVIIPGDVDKSRLIKAVLYTDPDIQMPPKGEKLTDQQIADLKEWVRQGAPDPRLATSTKLTGMTDKARAHWAYQAIKPQKVPSPTNAKWVQNPIDAFILAKQEQNGLSPAAPASKEALIRRATFDLIGLPPTLAEVQAFVEDSSPSAFQKVVDRLLASPHYGERWGRYWLDTARYADTAGPDMRYNDFRFPYAWTYRDYVIDAFNSDKPYDQFIKEQLAADLMPESKEDPSRLAALGFITVGKRLPLVNETLAERIDTITKATQAVTVACARCHDHKFDPIPTSDYYSLHGIFASSIEPARKPLIRCSQDQVQREDYEKKLAVLEQKNRDAYYRYLETKTGDFRNKASAYLMFIVHDRKALRQNQIERIRLINENKLDLEIYNGIRTVQKSDPVMGPLARYADLEENKFATEAPALTATILAGNTKAPINALVANALKEAFSEHAPQNLKEVTDTYGRLFAGISDQAGRYIKAAEQSKDGTIPGFEPALVQLIVTPLKMEPAKDLDSVGLLEVVKKLPLRNGNYGQFLFADINELELMHPGAPARAMAVEDSPTAHDSYVMIRGEPANRGPIAPRRYLEVLAGSTTRPVFKTGSGRLELADAIANKSNPLTARAMVNRIWLHHFGEGFVRTPEDLGVMSEPPSHPELFDYLAQKFMDDGWSFKKMHRRIMLSNTYQQSGTPRDSVAQIGNKKDPENRLLWHANLRRLDFESLRDSMLVFSGKIDGTIGGHPVNLTDEPFSYRRSIYGYIDRAALPDLLSQFDFSDPDMPNSHRGSTIVPQQALFFMNSPMSADIARKIAARSELVAATTESDRIKVLFQIMLQRNPKAEEAQLAHDFLAACPAAIEIPAPKAKTDVRKKASPSAVANSVKKPPANFTRSVQNEGSYVERRPLTPWEQLAQALLFTNDVNYID